MNYLTELRATPNPSQSSQPQPHPQSRTRLTGAAQTQTLPASQISGAGYIHLADSAQRPLSDWSSPCCRSDVARVIAAGAYNILGVTT